MGFLSGFSKVWFVENYGLTYYSYKTEILSIKEIDEANVTFDSLHKASFKMMYEGSKIRIIHCWIES